MPEAPDQNESIFPQLDDAQLARLAPFGEQRQAAEGEILYDQGDSSHGVFVVLSGSIEIAGGSSKESGVRVLGRGMFTGEVSQLSGRRSLVRCRGREASLTLEVGRENLRRIFQTDAALGEILLRAFLLRR